MTGTKVSDNAEYTFAVTENTALTAQFTKSEEPEPEVTHTVTIDGNAQEVADGGYAVRPETDPTKPGHEFLGWFAEGSETAFDFNTPITGDMTLTAKFEAYTVIPYNDGNGSVSATTMDENGYVTVAAEANDGYIFKGWAIDGKIVSYDKEYAFIPVKDTVITAVFEAVEPEVTYHTVTINGQTVQVEQYDFSQPVTSDLTITAKFEKIETPGEGDSGQDKPGTDKPGADTQKPGSGNTAVQTGDQSSPVIWAVVLIAACAAAAAVVVVRKKRK